MTVFSPSLPPSSWTTTRIFSLAFFSLPRAKAELARKAGTAGPQANRADEPRPRRRNSRRVGCMKNSLGSPRAGGPGVGSVSIFRRSPVSPPRQQGPPLLARRANGGPLRQLDLGAVQQELEALAQGIGRAAPGRLHDEAPGLRAHLALEHQVN